MIEQSGGRAGPNEFDFVNAGYKLDEIESLRQQLLNQNDVGKVQKAIKKLGIRVKRSIIQAVKNYNFDSQGLGFTYENYAAWRRLVTGDGTIGDAAYIVHDIAEIEELQRIRQENGFDFVKGWTKMLTDQDLAELLNDLNNHDVSKRAITLQAFWKFPSADERVIPHLERLLHDKTPCLLGIPYIFGEITRSGWQRKLWLRSEKL